MIRTWKFFSFYSFCPLALQNSQNYHFWNYYTLKTRIVQIFRTWFYLQQRLELSIVSHHTFQVANHPMIPNKKAYAGSGIKPRVHFLLGPMWQFRPAHPSLPRTMTNQGEDRKPIQSGHQVKGHVSVTGPHGWISSTWGFTSVGMKVQDIHLPQPPTMSQAHLLLFLFCLF